MRQFAKYFPRDEVPLDTSPGTTDLAFQGMDMREPSLVGPGWVSEALNKRLVDGRYETRPGMFCPLWALFYRRTAPYEDDIPGLGSQIWGDNLETYGRTYGAGTYSDPDGEIWMIRVTPAGLLFARENEWGKIVPYRTGIVVSGRVWIFQQFNQLIILRGDEERNLIWSGDWLEEVKEMIEDDVPSGYATVPIANYGLKWRDRSVFLAAPDDLVISRTLEPAMYSTAQDTDGLFFVNQGVGDKLKAAAVLGGGAILLLKSQSAHVFFAAAPDLSDARLDDQAIDVQFDAPGTVVTADGRVWWLDRRGIRTARIAGTDADGKILLDSEVMSNRIGPLIDRINWRAAEWFSASVSPQRIYFSVALDQQEMPQTILVWDRRSAAWESYDQWSADLDFDVIALTQAPWQGKTRTFAIGSEGFIFCLEYNLGEDVKWPFSVGSQPRRTWIADRLVTRGYTAMTSDRKEIVRAQLDIDTWAIGASGVTIEAVFPGPGARKTIGALSRDRTKYFTAAPDFDVSNADGRFHDPNRQDYSVTLTTLGELDLQEGIRLEDFQSQTERFDIGGQAAWCQLAISGSAGATRIRALSLEMNPGPNSNLT